MFYCSKKSCNKWVSAYSGMFAIYFSLLVMLILHISSLGSQRILAKISLWPNKYGSYGESSDSS